MRWRVLVVCDCGVHCLEAGRMANKKILRQVGRPTHSWQLTPSLRNILFVVRRCPDVPDANRSTAICVSSAFA